MVYKYAMGDSPNIALFMASSYDPGVVALSFLIASFASYVTLDLARRVRHAAHGGIVVWWVAGALVMGTGVWSMHFVGMQAFHLPITLGYSGELTLLSWIAAVAAAGVAFAVPKRARRPLWGVAFSSLVMGLGISAMHYLGMAAIDLAPGIVWSRSLVAASLLIAVGASASALWIFDALDQVPQAVRHRYQIGAAVVMGVAVCGMHYTGMAAARFPEGAVCLSAEALGGTSLTAMVVIATGLLLLGTLFTSVNDARMQGRAERLARSLQESNEALQGANEELRQRAFTDALTRLPNRLLFEERLNRALIHADRSNHHGTRTCVGVLFIDLDGFKPVNDSLGHAAGDHLLLLVADRLRHLARDSDTVARVGGDEFLMLLDPVNHVADVVTVAQRALHTLSDPVEIAGKTLHVEASIGIVVYPVQGQRSRLVAQADAAMYAAKRSGGSCYVLYEPHMSSDASDQLELQNDLRKAIEQNALTLHYQPKIDSERNVINGVEALLRWHHPVRGMVPPSQFIALAERFGLINRLGQWVIDEACRQIARWQEEGVRMRVAINVSVHQLREGGLAHRVEHAMQAHGVQPDQLLCEITESVAMEDVAGTQKAFEDLARIGVYLSIDDFGTGYSSLSYLRRMPARQLKIDRSFVQDLASGDDARAVVDAVISLAHALGLRVVAEGVETVAQRDILLAMGCDEMQGYLFARPMPASDLLAWARGNKPQDSADFSPSILMA